VRSLVHLGLLFLVLPLALRVDAQSNAGELRLKVTGPDGLPVKASVELLSQGNEYHHTFTTDDQVNLSVEIRSALPLDRTIRLKLISASESVTVSAAGTLVDPYRAGSVNEMGLQTIENRLTALPGRSMQELVNSEPGWLYEGNAVLHPRGSEYQTQFVVDGIPITDNRSPSFGPEVEADDAESLKIYTAGIPAEFGRKLGGVVEVNTLKSADPGFHGQLTLFGGTYDTAGINTQDQYTWKGNTLGVSASGNMTGHYLNPVVPQNYTNDGTTGSFSLSYERDLTQKDRLTLIVRHELARYEIPNEFVQQNGAYVPNAENTVGCPPVPLAAEPSDCVFIPGGQLQTGDNFETVGSVAYQHVFSSNAIGSLRGMARDNSNDFYSNPSSWPLIATQHNYFKEIYFNGSVSVHHGRRPFRYAMPYHFGYLGCGRDDFRIYRQPSGSRAVSVCPRCYPARQLDSQCWPSLGSLSVAGKPERRESACSHLALLRFGGRQCSRLLRPHLPDSIVREHSSLQFSGGGGSRHQRARAATPGSTFSRELLRSGSDQSIPSETAS
jgi:hypothetical protein